MKVRANTRTLKVRVYQLLILYEYMGCLAAGVNNFRNCAHSLTAVKKCIDNSKTKENKKLNRNKTYKHVLYDKFLYLSLLLLALHPTVVHPDSCQSSRMQLVPFSICCSFQILILWLTHARLVRPELHTVHGGI